MEEEIQEKKQEMDRLHKEARQPVGVQDVSKIEQKLSNVEQQVNMRQKSSHSKRIIIVSHFKSLNEKQLFGSILCCNNYIFLRDL